MHFIETEGSLLWPQDYVCGVDFEQEESSCHLRTRPLRCISPPFSPLRILFLTNFLFSPYIVSLKSVLSCYEITILYLPISFAVGTSDSVNLKME
jgi:hypothetical protein